LPAGTVKKLPVRIEVPPGTPLSETWTVDVSAYSPHPDLARGGIEWGLVSNLTLQASTVLDMDIGLDAWAQPSWSSPSSLRVRGCLTQPLADRVVTVDYFRPKGKMQSRLVTTDDAGCFEDTWPQPAAGIWKVRALWSGDGAHARAVSEKVGVGIGVNFADCCQATTSKGCGREDVQACVCADDPYCCASQWDALCVAEVSSFECGSCGNACTARPDPGARSAAMEACVCPQDPYCCDVAWDAICVNEVTTLGCGTC